LREADSKWPRLFPINGTGWFLGSYRVEFTAGYSNEDLIPVVFKQAIKLWAEAHYDRDPVMMPLLIKTAEGVLRSERSNLQMA